MNAHTNPLSDPPEATRLGRTEDIRRGALLGIAVLALLLPPHQLAPRQGPAVASAASGQPPRLPDLGSAATSDDTRLLAHWVVETGDNAGMAFVVIDKKAAQLHLFDAAARLSASTPVLLGSAQGDDTVPGIGLRPIEEVRPEERTTPAGRFLGIRGRNHTGEDVVWVDHDAAVSMHRVRTTQPRERRLQRLASPSVADKRISYGCINVPAAFFDAHIAPTFATRRAVIYVLPEQKTLQQVFGAHPRLMPAEPPRPLAAHTGLPRSGPAALTTPRSGA